MLANKYIHKNGLNIDVSGKHLDALILRVHGCHNIAESSNMINQCAMLMM